MGTKYDHNQFIRVWRRSRSASQAAFRLGISPSVARSRACYLRAHGIRLKMMPGGRKAAR